MTRDEDSPDDDVEERPWRQLERFEDAHQPLQLTPRAVFAGLFVGTLLCFTNMYFGLQTGWVTMGSIQCALVGFGIFRLPWRLLGARTGRLRLPPFGPLENVVVQTVGVATATLPLAGGFIGIIPALGMLDPPVVLTVWQQLGWAAALTYFGIFFAVPLRRQTILVEKLPFPSGTATAKLIDLLHDGGDVSETAKFGSPLASREPASAGRGPWRALSLSFAASFGLAALGTFVPAAANLHVGTWLGVPALTRWHWTLRPALSYVGQGMIMGPRSAFSLLGGALAAWGLLGPMARSNGWASGPIGSFESGAQGWVLWVAIALMVCEALTAFAIATLRQAAPGRRPQATTSSAARAHDIDAHASRPSGAAAAPPGGLEVAPAWQLVPTRWWVGGAGGALVLCVSIVSPMFALPVWQVGLAVLLSCLVAILAVRALGQTDLNPVSGVGKLSQIVFALVAPGHVVANIVAGALAEAGATQAGDLLQDLKTGHLLRASPRAQFQAQLIGATWSIFVTVFAYQLYDRSYGVPSAQFAAPVAHVWKDMAVLMQSGLSALPPSAVSFAAAFGVGGSALAAAEAFLPAAAAFLPSGISFGIGMYLTPDWTVPRVLGAIVELAWRRSRPDSHKRSMLVVASGFVLGEGCWSIVALGIKVARG